MPAPFLKGYTPMDLIEKFWQEILSRDPLRIKAAFKPLCDREQNEVYNHLKRMSCDDGWHLEQTSVWIFCFVDPVVQVFPQAHVTTAS